MPGATSVLANSINNAGHIVGAFSDSTGGHGYLDVNGTFTRIDVPGATSTGAFGINNADDIVGSFNDSTGRTHGFLDVDGTFTLIDGPGAFTTQAIRINDTGQIVGFFRVSRIEHGFVATPSGTVPEPATLSLVGVGLLGLLTARRHSST